jgi:hypothetical protein
MQSPAKVQEDSPLPGAMDLFLLPSKVGKPGLPEVRRVFPDGVY